MILFLQAIAFVLTIAGAVTFYLGNDPSMLSLGNTLMIVGAIGAVGGLVLFALSVVASRLDRVARGIDTLKLGVTPVPAMVPALRPADAEPRMDEVPPPGEIDLSTLRAAEPARVEPAVADLPPVLRRDTPSLHVEPVKSDGPETVRPVPVPPLPAPIRPVPVEPARVEALPVEAPKTEPAAVEPEAEPAKAEPAKVEPPPIEAARTEPVAAPPVGAVPPAVEPAPPVAAPEMPAEPPRRMTFRERFGWKSAAATVGAAAAVGAAAGASRGEERQADPAPAPTGGDKAGAAPENRGGKSLEEILGGGLTDPKPLPAVPVPPRPARAVEEDDLMARLRASILGPDPAPAPAASEPEAAPETEPEPVEEPAPAIEEPKAPASSIEEELERALKAALGREVPAAPDPRDRFAPAPARPAPEPEAQRTAAPTGEGAMAALARDFPELGDILKRTPPPEPVEPVVIGRDGDEVHDSHAMESVTEEPAEAEPASQPEAEAREAGEPAGAAPAAEEPPEAPRAAPEPAAPEPAAAAAPARTAPLLREGVIAGIPFRLYGDGSIEADLPSGTTRFASLRDFRAHVGG